jgi:hypothetical protein
VADEPTSPPDGEQPPSSAPAPSDDATPSEPQPDPEAPTSFETEDVMGSDDGPTMWVDDVSDPSGPAPAFETETSERATRPDKHDRG